VVLRRSTRLLITLGAVAALLVVGGISAASLLGPHPATEPEVAEAAAPRMRAEAHTVINAAAKLAFDIPPDWQPAADDESLTTSNGVRLDHLVDWGPYTCQGAEYGRAFAASGVAPNDRKPNRAASELAGAVAADQYSDGHQTASVKVDRAQPLTKDGVEGSIVRAEATLTDSTDRCAGSKGTITVVALPTSAGNSVFVIGADVTAGPEEPTPLADAQRIDSIVSSLRVAP
jgi:hypothetical protein